MPTNKVIKVAGISNRSTPFGATEITLLENLEGGKTLKYTFLDKKKDGDDTIAYRDYQTVKPMVGDEIKLGVVEEPYTFTGKDGKEVNAVRNKVIGIAKLT